MRKFLAFVLGWCIIIVCAIGAIQTTAFNKKFYSDYYKKSNLSEQIGTSENDIEKGMAVMLDYLQGTRKTMHATLTEDGKTVEMYNEKEISHMKDVKALYDHARMVRRICSILGIVLFIFLFFSCAKYPGSGRMIASQILTAALCFLLVAAFLGIWALTDFTDLWTRFHLLFFSNYNWLLDPATDFMIRICPEEMFFKLIVKILINFVLFYLPFLLACALYLFKTRSRFQDYRTIETQSASDNEKGLKND